MTIMSRVKLVAVTCDSVGDCEGIIKLESKTHFGRLLSNVITWEEA